MKKEQEITTTKSGSQKPKKGRGAGSATPKPTEPPSRGTATTPSKDGEVDAQFKAGKDL